MQLVVFDFDWSFADQDTDRYVFEVLSPELRKTLRASKATVQWTDNVANHLKLLHQEGKTREDIESALQGLPVHPAMIRGVQNLKGSTEKPTTFLCLSNSNQVFIDTILKHNNVTVFSDIITNPAHFEASGLLSLSRRVPPTGPQHGCTVGCSPNMCKGKELDEYINKNGGWDAFTRVVYVGDGGNDFCPALRLRSQDVILVRAYRELSRRIVKESDKPIKANIHPWGGAWEVEDFFKNA